jgi:VIT1/CCC1 family predicted Fe2+/Mn2+ transporter
MERSDRRDLDLWRENWRRELEGTYLYGELTKTARHPETAKALAEMAEQEEQHAALWESLCREAGSDDRPPRRDLRVFIIAWLGRLLGAEAVLGLLVQDELSDIATYVDQAEGSDMQERYKTVVGDETNHARSLQMLRGGKARYEDEPWHRTSAAGGTLRQVVYGFNDGLTANFGLVMGVIGASVSDSVVLLAGIAGLLADALSMASSGYLAARSEDEVRQFHLKLERAEIELMPGEEHDELARQYESKGLTADEARAVADRLMANPQAALAQLAREELGIDPEPPGSPLREGVVTGIATGLGAFIPLIPFLVVQGAQAVSIAVGISMLAHFVVGAGRAVFTGRPALRSGFDMFVVGMGVALATYLIGLLFGVAL